MKRFLLSLCLTGSLFAANSQTIMYSETFELNPSFITVASGGFGFTANNDGNAFVNGNTPAGGRPASTAYASGGLNAYRETNGTGTLTSANLSTAGANFVALRFRLMSVSLISDNGHEDNDFIRVEISPNGQCQGKRI
ncbi:MAG: hypothetical protein K2X48_17980 [Chitinophagaceae bacterium]|nr:hypothetical protein [Chitinophagaceae bacterium]